MIEIFQTAVLIYFITINLWYTALMISAFLEMRRRSRQVLVDDHSYLLRSPLSPRVSILVPAHNEEKTVVDAVRSHLAIKYPNFEIIVVNDGSTDRTMEALDEEFKLRKIDRIVRHAIETQPIRGYYVSETRKNLIVIDKDNGGKADALNTALNAASSDYFISIDADVILEEDAILRMMKPVIDDSDRLVAAGGIVMIANGCSIVRGRLIKARLSRRILPRFQVIEYLRAFVGGRAGFSRFNTLVIISGAFGVFQTITARIVRGYEKDTVGEDFELIVKFHRYLRRQKTSYRVAFLPHPVCWTEGPETVGVLSRQRSRWHRGLSETLWKYRSMLYNPRYGRIGMIALPFYLLFEFLGPLVEVAGYAYFTYLLFFGAINTPFAILFISIAVMWGMALSLAAVFMEEQYFEWYSSVSDKLRLILLALLENLGYRQMTLGFRMKGLIDFLRGAKSWGKMTRTGFGRASR